MEDKIYGGETLLVEYLYRYSKSLVILCDERLQLIWCNSAFLRISNLDKMPVGSSINEFLNDDCKLAFEELENVLDRNMTLEFSFHGSIIPYNCIFLGRKNQILIVAEGDFLSESSLIDCIGKINNEMASITRDVARKNLKLAQSNAKIRQLITTDYLTGVQQNEERYRSLSEKVADARKPAHYTENTYGVFSKKMQQVIEQAEQYATDRSISVLICGETGTGKEKIARIVHSSDPTIQDEHPFIAINCAAITASLFESELFGYEPGAFTGALKTGQIGKIQLAAGGTLFLDEIGDMSLAMQAKLLRVIQEKEFYRVGGLKKVKMNVRIVCATNSNLLRAIAEGRFRKDLYYRLKVGYLYLYPLRERTAEIIPLATMFLQYFAEQNGKVCNVLGESATSMLSAYDWPGNIRELRNTMEWAAFMYDGVPLEAEDLSILRAGEQSKTTETYPKSLDAEAASMSGNLKAYADQLVQQTLESHAGNKAAAARELGISRRALYRLLEKTDKKSLYN